jgi:hypothetical protein
MVLNRSGSMIAGSNPASVFECSRFLMLLRIVALEEMCSVWEVLQNIWTIWHVKINLESKHGKKVNHSWWIRRSGCVFIARYATECRVWQCTLSNPAPCFLVGQPLCLCGLGYRVRFQNCLRNVNTDVCGWRCCVSLGVFQTLYLAHVWSPTGEKGNFDAVLHTCLPSTAVMTVLCYCRWRGIKLIQYFRYLTCSVTVTYATGDVNAWLSASNISAVM